ncbi:MAG: RsmE family RNA methyltransferase [Gemmatimonadaceae bacterium]
MVERQHRPVVTFFWSEPVAAGDQARLDDDPVRHARARRITTGDPVRLVDGKGRVATGEITGIAKRGVTVSVDGVVEIPRPVPLEVCVPVADRDRMLTAAEKCVELQVTAWRPVYFARSRSVSPRGEGPKFAEKVKARMQAALEQSGGAWMPDFYEEVEVAAVWDLAQPEWNRVVLEGRGRPLSRLVTSASSVLAVGPEGGLERHELAAAESRGWVAASLATTTLRFETAVIAGAAVIRAMQLSLRGS